MNTAPPPTPPSVYDDAAAAVTTLFLCRNFQAREAQKPIIESGKLMLQSSSDLIKTARLLANNPKDPPSWQQMANHSRIVSDSIKKLVANIRFVISILYILMEYEK